MSIVYSNQNGWFVSHLEYIQSVYLSGLNEIERDKYALESFRKMFDIQSPFLKDEQFAKLKSQIQNPATTETLIKSKKRKRKLDNSGNICEESLQIQAQFKKFMQDLHKTSITSSPDSPLSLVPNSPNSVRLLSNSIRQAVDNNLAARQQCHIMYEHMREYFGGSKEENCTWKKKKHCIPRAEQKKDFKIWEKEEKMEEKEEEGEGTILPFKGENKEDHVIFADIRNPNTRVEDRFVLPPHCKFFNWDIRHLGKWRTSELCGPRGKFDFVLLDPPWTNKFIRRKKRQRVSASSNWYNTMSDTCQLSEIPMDAILNPDGLVGVWCTNNRTHMEVVTEVIFPAWGLTYVATWYWMKVGMDAILNPDGLVGVWCTNNRTHMEVVTEVIFPAWGLTYVATWYWMKVTKYLDPVIEFSSAPHSKQPYERLIFAVRNSAINDGNPVSYDDSANFSRYKSTAENVKSHDSVGNSATVRNSAGDNGPNLNARNSLSSATSTAIREEANILTGNLACPAAQRENGLENPQTLTGNSTNSAALGKNAEILTGNPASSVKFPIHGEERSSINEASKHNAELLTGNSTNTAAHGKNADILTGNPTVEFPIHREETLTINKAYEDNTERLTGNSANPSELSRNPPSSVKFPVNGEERSSRSEVRRWPEDKRLLVSVPSGVHSHKPPLADVIAPYLPPRPHCLELFARNLTPRWTSLGNQVLAFQAEQFYR
ncbi:hypothetical protein M8J77_008335 [Diaphorina citri]|nr:hypothetical protein M8J77_008335 [Diaphorina citri]